MTVHLLRTALAAACLASPAIAQHAVSSSDTRIVSTRGLDLSKPDDVRTLDLRLGRAVADACGTGSIADPERTRHMLACRRDAQARVSAARASAIAAAHASSHSEMLAVQTR
jgi:UrcA family protein